MKTQEENKDEIEIPTDLEKISTGWRPNKETRKTTFKNAEYHRKQIGVITVGKQILAPITTWKDMRLPREFIDVLYDVGIKLPTNIQMQAIPTALSGRDMITFASVGKGKSWIPIVPIIGLCIQEEKSMPIIRGEGPFAIVLAPSHEFASSLYDKISNFVHKLTKRGLIHLRCIRLIGGVDSTPNFEPMKKGIHIIVGTPARMLDLLRKRIYNLEYCKSIVLYEGFRLIDTAFNEDLYELLDQANKERQIILLSSAVPKKLDEFIGKYMKDPVIISEDYTTIPQFNVIQEVIYVRPEDKITAILDVLQKTAPPVLIFCENTKDVEIVHDFLIIKGINSTAAHGNMDINEKAEALKYYKSGRSDILVTTDSVIKMVELENVKHVINYDMSRQIDGYISRINRAGKNEVKGHSTTFINKGTDYSALMDLKDLLTETKSEVPHYLQMLEIRENLECHYCGSRAHRYNRCRRKEIDKLVKFLDKES